MSDPRRIWRREPAEARREAMVRAVLSLVSEGGMEAATVRAIAERAEVTPGLIRHYFATKEDLLAAAYEAHMDDLNGETARHATGATATARLAAFVAGGLRPPVVDPAAVGLWAGFINLVRRDGRMRAIHERTYRDFRDRLERMIAEALAEAGRPPDPARLRDMAIACNAVIDGLWLEGGALPGGFGDDDLERIGLASVGAIIGLDLQLKGDAP
ncbi:MAG: TetR family transcriptional regulator C-terminal domain-containing protein [Rubellimicrobium sp.]|nr:TetR family transcriptional regulator C-terminal domain-containing protein [Rubellimicrobium sp.]